MEINIHITTEKVLEGYRFKAFEDAWERYLPSLPAGSATKRPSATAYLLSSQAHERKSGLRHVFFDHDGGGSAACSAQVVVDAVVGNAALYSLL